MTNELFTTIGQVERDPNNLVRPLGEFSNFIVEKAPTLLKLSRLDGEQSTDAKHLLLEETDRLACAISGSEGISFDPNHTASSIARLDVMIANRMVRLAGMKPLSNLQQLVDIYTPEGFIPDSTYGDLILVNPDSDMRTLSGDNREADFYRAHRQIEEPLESYVQTINDSILSGAMDTDQLINDSEGLYALVRNMGALYRDLTDFNEVIRPSLMSIPDYPHHGPSGVDSATMYSLDLLASGVSLPEELFTFLNNNYNYFHPSQRSLLTSALNIAANRQSLFDMEQTGNMEAKRLRAFILNKVEPFRRVHRKSVEKHIPGAVEGQTDGTGGISASDLINFLIRRETMHARN